MANTIAIGSLVMVGSGPARKYGTVSFIGETQFSNGEWIGIILQTPDGKNDGSVDGVRYFECERLYGLFVRRAQVVSVDQNRTSGIDSRLSIGNIARDRLSTRPSIISSDFSEKKNIEDKSSFRPSVSIDDINNLISATEKSPSGSNSAASLVPSSSAKGSGPITNASRLSLSNVLAMDQPNATGSQQRPSLADIMALDPRSSNVLPSSNSNDSKAEASSASSVASPRPSLAPVSVKSGQISSASNSKSSGTVRRDSLAPASRRESLGSSKTVPPSRNAVKSATSSRPNATSSNEGVPCLSSTSDLSSSQSQNNLESQSPVSVENGDNDVGNRENSSAEMLKSSSSSLTSSDNQALAKEILEGKIQAIEMKYQKLLMDYNHETQSHDNLKNQLSTLRAKYDEEKLKLTSQIEEFQDQMEMLSLDKEQLNIDLELQEETIQSLQSRLKSMEEGHGKLNLGSALAVDPQILENENQRLRDGLKKLNEKSQEEIHHLLAKIDSLKEMVKSNDQYRLQNEKLEREVSRMKEEIVEIQEEAEFYSNYESLIESLSERKESLLIEVGELKEALTYYEGNQDLMEEIDAKQREEIESLRASLEQLERKYRDKILHLAEESKKVQELISINQQLKRTVAELQAKVEEYSSLISTLQEQISLFSKRSMASVENNFAISKNGNAIILAGQLLRENMQFVMLQTEYQESLYFGHRMEDIFGKLPLFFQEMNGYFRRENRIWKAMNHCVVLCQNIGVYFERISVLVNAIDVSEELIWDRFALSIVLMTLIAAFYQGLQVLQKNAHFSVALLNPTDGKLLEERLNRSIDEYFGGLSSCLERLTLWLSNFEEHYFDLSKVINVVGLDREMKEIHVLNPQLRGLLMDIRQLKFNDHEFSRWNEQASSDIAAEMISFSSGFQMLLRQAWTSVYWILFNMASLIDRSHAKDLVRAVDVLSMVVVGSEQASSTDSRANYQRRMYSISSMENIFPAFFHVFDGVISSSSGSNQGFPWDITPLVHYLAHFDREFHGASLESTSSSSTSVFHSPEVHQEMSKLWSSTWNGIAEFIKLRFFHVLSANSNTNTRNPQMTNQSLEVDSHAAYFTRLRHYHQMLENFQENPEKMKTLVEESRQLRTSNEHFQESLRLSQRRCENLEKLLQEHTARKDAEGEFKQGHNEEEKRNGSKGASSSNALSDLQHARNTIKILEERLLEKESKEHPMTSIHMDGVASLTSMSKDTNSSMEGVSKDAILRSLYQQLWHWKILTIKKRCIALKPLVKATRDASSSTSSFRLKSTRLAVLRASLAVKSKFRIHSIGSQSSSSVSMSGSTF